MILNSSRIPRLKTRTNDRCVVSCAPKLSKMEDPPKIHLSLRAPKHWQVKLTTSSSTPIVDIPDIILQDSKGRIILEAPGRKGSPSHFARNSKSPSPRKHKKEIKTDEDDHRNNIPKIKIDEIFNNCHSNIPRYKKRLTKKRQLNDKPLKNIPLGSDYVGAPKGDYCHGLTGCPCGPYEETVALAPTNAVCRDDATCEMAAVYWDAHRLTGPNRRRTLSARPRPRPAMGSNVSRHSGKGLDGRRSQSSGNLCHGAKLLAPSVGRLFNPCGAGGVSPRDRSKFCGSLPNHLDDKDLRRGDGTPESFYNGNNNYGEVYGSNPGVQLVLGKLTGEGVVGDQGYSSERSPEDEALPPLPPPDAFQTSHPFLPECPFITKDNLFEVTIAKGARGLGLSVTGGADTDEPLAGLIRIKRLFPHQPAWESGVLHVGDILLEASGTPLTGLTNYEALEVLRTTPQTVCLLVCRPPQSELPSPLPPGEPPPPPRRDPQAIPSSLPLDLTLSPNPEPCGEFDITLHKVNGSLGFTLRKEDESVLGHYVRALVREPAMSDGRIRPGDKIVAVNGMDISPLTHEEAVQMLRQCGETVCIRLYRDSAQTPVSALSPTELSTPRRTALRQEAVDMLSCLAVRRNSPGESSSPRRRRLERADPTRNSESTVSSKGSRTARPAFLDLDGDSSRKNQYSLADLENEPASLPPLGSSNAFSPGNPVYQSAHSPCPPPSSLLSEPDGPSQPFEDSTGSHGLLKWKGVVFTPEDGVDDVKETTPKTSDSNHSETTEEGEVLTVELSKGWNSRLGFSLQSCGKRTIISAIYADSVAARDGRLQEGDRVLMINDERADGMSTSEVIDLLRKIRGAIAITVLRPSSSHSS